MSVPCSAALWPVCPRVRRPLCLLVCVGFGFCSCPFVALCVSPTRGGGGGGLSLPGKVAPPSYLCPWSGFSFFLFSLYCLGVAGHGARRWQSGAVCLFVCAFCLPSKGGAGADQTMLNPQAVGPRGSLCVCVFIALGFSCFLRLLGRQTLKRLKL